jgi:hypothetical protein
MTDFEYYATPLAFTRYLYWAMAVRGAPITGRCFEPCVGSGAIVQASHARWVHKVDTGERTWRTCDLDPRWPANCTGDATATTAWLDEEPDWVQSNPPFTQALGIIEQSIKHARVGVAMLLRASIHEVLKTGLRRTWMRQHLPTGILWLPRFAYQRSRTTGKWATDNVCACWVVWLQDATAAQFIDYAPEWVIDELDAETPSYRAHMDEIMGTSEHDHPPREGLFVGEIP